MASNNLFNKLKKKELTDDERAEMKEKFADVSISSVPNYNSICKTCLLNKSIFQLCWMGVFVYMQVT